MTTFVQHMSIFLIVHCTQAKLTVEHIKVKIEHFPHDAERHVNSLWLLLDSLKCFSS